MSNVNFQLWVLSALVSLSVTVGSGLLDGDGRNTGTPVECSDNQSVFLGELEFVFLGDSDFLVDLERKIFSELFVKVYNGLTERSCDSYFRRIQQLDFLQMTNRPFGQTVTAQDMGLLDLIEDQLPIPPDPPQRPENNDNDQNNANQNNDNDNLPPPPPPLPRSSTMTMIRQSSNVNSSDTTEGVDVTYSVAGTCRDCPVTRTGSFSLFDDAFRFRFRRMLQAHTSQNLTSTNTTNTTSSINSSVQLHLQELQELHVQSITFRNLQVIQNQKQNQDKSDCTCQPGFLPERPEPPQIPKLVQNINQAIEQARSMGEPIFNDSRLQLIRQLDDLTDIITDNTNDNDSTNPNYETSELGHLYDDQQTQAKTSHAYDNHDDMTPPLPGNRQLRKTDTQSTIRKTDESSSAASKNKGYIAILALALVGGQMLCCLLNW
ncbi:expressed unknown protein [Seminavis robusta]|uniref:Uncharacterized protein n=1 Tax=Seminavis robusta TaxID=568900 RepID=A0A9N8HRQ0_9STRA|nr:expressed unknown protein [Seminavis robusta]|eukprot:Sro1297_g260440.1 n/a (433) ;mRNA; r:7454-8752